MKITKQARRDAKELFRSSQVNGQLDEGRVRRAVTLVLEKKPRGYQAILAHFQRLVKLDVARRTARVETAVPIEPALQARVQENLSRLYGNALQLSFNHNPELIGGMRIKVGSDVYDGSIQARLNALKEKF